MSQLKKNNILNLYFEVLTDGQKREFPNLIKFRKLGILAGGTALALQLGHRRSYDFDIFFSKPLIKNLLQKARRIFGKISIVNRFEEELSFITPFNVKITFFYYPFYPLFSLVPTSSIEIIHWKDIALDKMYTIGRRAQYRDYIDLFYIMKKKKTSLDWLIKNALKKFEGLFSEKLFLDQLIYFADLRIEAVEFSKKEYGLQEIQKFFEKKVQEYTKKKIK